MPRVDRWKRNNSHYWYTSRRPTHYAGGFLIFRDNGRSLDLSAFANWVTVTSSSKNTDDCHFFVNLNTRKRTADGNLESSRQVVTCNGRSIHTEVLVIQSYKTLRHLVKTILKVEVFVDIRVSFIPRETVFKFSGERSIINDFNQ